MMADDVAQKQADIVAGFKNAMSRGETLDMARITFLNAGYSPQIVNAAANSLVKGPTVVQQRVPARAAPSGLNLYAKSAPVPQPVSAVPPRGIFGSGVPYWVVILMILMALGIVIGAGVVGLYWNKLF